jgi:ribosomal protein L11 methylase PrmA
MESSSKISSSFRDPCGFLFIKDGVIYRQLNRAYAANYDHLIDSGLYRTLTEDLLLISHKEVNLNYAFSSDAYKIIMPQQIDFISYPYEWCFSQFKDAALTMLKIQKIAMNFGMSIKDASAYNIQFIDNRPILIDTLSFEKYTDGEPWIAYRQFCQHFLAPLALTSYTDVRLNRLLWNFIDGIPLDLSSRLLPFRTRLRLSLLLHIHLHAKSQTYFADKPVPKIKRVNKMGRSSMLGLIESLESAVSNLKWRHRNTEWSGYYKDTNYSQDAITHKKEIVESFLDKIHSKNVWDLGANVGLFSRIAAKRGLKTISFDIDPAVVEDNYLDCRRQKEKNILPLLLDLSNPSPAIGWQNQERMSFLERGPADTVFALALIHHLVVSNNLPLDTIAEFLKSISSALIIEFVPKSDSQFQRLLASREDIFTNYSKQSFEETFKRYFRIEDSVKIRNSERTLYLMKKL